MAFKKSEAMNSYFASVTQKDDQLRGKVSAKPESIKPTETEETNAKAKCTSFQCKVTKYKIDFIIDKNMAQMDYVYCDYKYPKAFAQLLRTCISELQKENIKIITQLVNKKEWNEFLKGKTTWKLTNDKNITDTVNSNMKNVNNMKSKFEKDTDVLVIMCDIEDFLRNMDVGLGLTG